MNGDNTMDRRALIKGLMGAGAGAAGLSLGGCSSAEPPTYGNLLRMGDWLTYKAQRLLIPKAGLVREYDRNQISSIVAIGSTDPAKENGPYYSPEFGDAYAKLRKGDFADWRLTVEGAVKRPGSFAVADLRAMARRTQITKHTCEEGWSAIAEWTGVPLRTVLEAVGIRTNARYVQLYAYDAVAEGIDMIDALHPQTILAYGMNGQMLPEGHGAPLRARVETQLGYKSVKFLRRIVVTEKFDPLENLSGLSAGFSWFAGI